MSTEPRLLVTGANGQLGRRAVELLLARGGAKVVAGTRDPAKVADLVAGGAEARRIDFDDPASLAAGFAGIDRALIVSTDALMPEGRRARQQVAAVEAAAAAGVRHLVYTSMPNPAGAPDLPIAPSHRVTEEAIHKAGTGHTILRNYWYADGLVEPLARALAAGQWMTAAGEGRVAYVTREDCARVAAAALAAAEGREVLDVTGPEALTAAEIAAIAGEVAGRPLAVVPITDEQSAAGLRAAQLPEPVVALVTGIDRLNREGGLSRVTDTVERLTGRPPQSVRDFLAASRAALTA